MLPLNTKRYKKFLLSGYDRNTALKKIYAVRVGTGNLQKGWTQKGW